MRTQIVLAAAALLLCAGCTAESTGSARSVAVRPEPAQPVATRPATGQPAARAAATPAAAERTVTASLTRYDTAREMVEFEVMRYLPGGANNGHWEPDPADAGTHRLPLAPDAEILSVIDICSTGLTADSQGNPTQRCSTDQLVQKLDSGTHPLAKLHIDGKSRIDRVAEIYHP